jgi:hypothetical protein
MELNGLESEQVNHNQGLVRTAAWDRLGRYRPILALGCTFIVRVKCTYPGSYQGDLGLVHPRNSIEESRNGTGQP